MEKLQVNARPKKIETCLLTCCDGNMTAKRLSNKQQTIAKATNRR